jgi:hypothetical protein
MEPTACGAAAQKVFATPAQAAQALVSAVAARDTPAVLAVLGPSAGPLIHSGDPVQDRDQAVKFLALYAQRHALTPASQDSMTLNVGAADWPLPIPIVRDRRGWRFDTAQGTQELLERRIGRNELATIAACTGYVAAQRDYAGAPRDGHPAGIYAAKLMSDPGRRNGLYWPDMPGQPQSPAGPLLARAAAKGYAPAGAAPREAPYHGYLYRMLLAQGSHARGGARSYLVRGKLSRGFALVAYPVSYRSSGVMTFIVDQDGVTYQKDLGPRTAQRAHALQRFDPDSSWTAVR